jgi:misacylated tRNA(Ala) deacylase
MELIFQDDAYAESCRATVTAADMAEGIRLDRTVFYPMGGGQLGDTGRLTWSDGTVTAIADTRKGADHRDVVHVPAPDSPLPAVGSEVTATIDWARRYRLMRMHTTLHLLCSLVPGDVTGGQVGESKSRLDFNITGDQVDKDALTAALNRIVENDHAVRIKALSDADLDAQPDLVRTMSVQPPRDGGIVRLIEVEGVDLQPCGGTHVARTGEIGTLRIGKVESKGRQNRRINVHLESP